MKNAFDSLRLLRHTRHRTRLGMLYKAVLASYIVQERELVIGVAEMLLDPRVVSFISCTTTVGEDGIICHVTGVDDDLIVAFAIPIHVP